MLDIPHEGVEHVSWLIYARRRELRSRWRRLSCFQQALLVLVHLRNNETPHQVGAGFGVSTATAGRLCDRGRRHPGRPGTHPAGHPAGP
ncbi:transposase family protein [Streptomyces sp. TX20-6-3]|uniref:helix-turn-helix domain-containing protein n=1 Tax=Streptomyces sp. TX20-6-3 TaxID=3028705 RepID=UPI0034E03E1F